MPSPIELARARERLLDVLRRQGITDERTLAALAQVPRELFLPAELRGRAYDNAAQPIGAGQTISQPYIVALMTEALELDGDEKVLEIGTGSGYQCAVLAMLAGSVYTIERVEELSDRARETLKSLGVTNVHFRVGDGSGGWPEQAPFDRIVVTAAAPQVPESLLGQLAPGGILVLPVGGESHQSLIAYRLAGETMQERHLCECRFVPLVGREGWPFGD